MKNLQGWMILGIACLAGCVGTTIPVQAQQTATAIVVKERLVEHVGDRLIIDMKLALDELSLPANRSLVCTPLIERGDSVRIILHRRDGLEDLAQLRGIVAILGIYLRAVYREVEEGASCLHTLFHTLCLRRDVGQKRPQYHRLCDSDREKR